MCPMFLCVIFWPCVSLFKSAEELPVEKEVVLSRHGLTEDFRVGESRHAATRGRGWYDLF